MSNQGPVADPGKDLPGDAIVHLTTIGHANPVFGRFFSKREVSLPIEKFLHQRRSALARQERNDLAPLSGGTEVPPRESNFTTNPEMFAHTRFLQARLCAIVIIAELFSCIN
jgi:hypothetical protein